VTDWAVVWLGVIAAAVAIMAMMQIGLVIVCLRLARQLSATADEIRRDVQPLVAKVHRIADDAARATSLAAVQVERVDEMLSRTVARVDDVAGIVRNAMGGPIRQGYAVAMAVRAALSVFGGGPSRGRRRDARTRDDEDALFVG
jgi:hypothetical protein